MGSQSKNRGEAAPWWRFGHNRESHQAVAVCILLSLVYLDLQLTIGSIIGAVNLCIFNLIPVITIALFFGLRAGRVWFSY